MLATIKVSALLVVIVLFLCCGSIASAQSKDQQLLQAAMLGDIAQVQSLLSKGARLSARDDQGFSALHLAVVTGNHKLLSTIVTDKHIKREDLNIKAGNKGYTALMMAAFSGDKGAVELLLNSGVDPSIRNSDGATAFNLVQRRVGATNGTESDSLAEVARLLKTKSAFSIHIGNDPNGYMWGGGGHTFKGTIDGHKVQVSLILFTYPDLTRLEVNINHIARESDVLSCEYMFDDVQQNGPYYIFSNEPFKCLRVGRHEVSSAHCPQSVSVSFNKDYSEATLQNFVAPDTENRWCALNIPTAKLKIVK